MNSKTQIFFLKRLGFLLSSGRSLHESLELCARSEGPKFKGHLEPIQSEIAEGKSFGESLKAGKILKDSFSIQIIILGEKTGNLAHAVDLASSELEAKRNLYNKIFGALLYPALVVSGTLLIALSLVFLIFPKVLPIFLGLGVKLPLSTQFLIWSIGTVARHWVLALIIALVFISTSIYIFKKQHWRIPLVKHLWLSRVLRIIGLTTKSGMPLDQSIAFCAETLSEPHYKMALHSFVAKVKEGEKIGVILASHSALFPKLTSSFIDSAEQSGTLSEAFLYLSSFYQSEMETMTKRLTELIEPALMIVLGLGIGFIGVSLITPIYGITNNIYH